MQQLEYLYGFFFKRADSVFNSVYIVGGAAAAYRREVLQEVGGFDHSIITEDIEMSTRILSRGYKTRYAGDAVIYTEGPSDLRGLCNQRLRWKYGRILTFIKHRRLFFSVRPEHNPYLTFLVLPIAIYSELLLLAEALLLGFFFLYTVVTSDYMPLAFVIGLLTAVVYVQVLIDPKIRFHRNLLLLAPVAWLLFYAVDMVEFQALVRSLKRLLTRSEPKWQKWVRSGVAGDPRIESQPVYD
jgi:cellulose synthase/poly-beta-1,6-N-acetylglucosamine synthase-like glycosyltransferase